MNRASTIPHQPHINEPKRSEYSRTSAASTQAKSFKQERTYKQGIAMNKHLISYLLIFSALQPSISMAMDDGQPGPSNNRPRPQRQTRQQRIEIAQQAARAQQQAQAEQARRAFAVELNTAAENQGTVCLLCKTPDNITALPCHQGHMVCADCSEVVVNRLAQCPLCKVGIIRTSRGIERLQTREELNRIINACTNPAQQAADQIRLALMCRDGINGDPDYSRASALLESVIHHNANPDLLVEAQLHLAALWEFGFLHTENNQELNRIEQSKTLYEAILTNNTATPAQKATALLKLGLMWIDGRAGLDGARARMFFEQVIALGNHACREDVASAQLHFAITSIQEGYDSDEQDAHSRGLLEQVLANPHARAEDKARAHYFLADLVHNGRGGEQNDVRARELYEAFIRFETALDEELASAQLILANMYRDGQGGEQNLARARELYEIVAANDDDLFSPDNRIDAQLSLADMCRDGLGGNQDRARTDELYTLVVNDEEADPELRALARQQRTRLRTQARTTTASSSTKEKKRKRH